MAILEAKSVSFTWQGSTAPAVQDVHCLLSTGDFILLTGGNGSGKSTLARLLAGLMKPTEGEISITPSHFLGWNGVALLMQDPQNQFIASTVEDEIAWGLENLGLESRLVKQRLEWILRRFEIESLRKTPPEALSDGQKQIVILASLVAMKPDFLILDEATSYLHLDWARKIWAITLELTKDMGVIWIASRKLNGLFTGRIWKMSGGVLVV